MDPYSGKTITYREKDGHVTGTIIGYDSIGFGDDRPWSKAVKVDWNDDRQDTWVPLDSELIVSIE